MPTSNRSDFRHWSRQVSATNRIAVYGPVCTVVWQGSVGDCCPYADQPELSANREAIPLERIVGGKESYISTVVADGLRMGRP
jgi:hypothetical protein